MFSVVTTRYTDETWESRERYKSITNIKCIYASPFKMAVTIDLKSPVFIIEMNNSVNKIMGIGLIRNKIETEKVYKVHDNPNYNRYIYTGEYYMPRELLENHNSLLVTILDESLFKGYTHSKRGAGFTKIPIKVLDAKLREGFDINNEIKKVFIGYFRGTNKEK